MPARKNPRTPAPARGYKLMVGFGLVNVGVKYAPAARRGRTYAKTLCTIHDTPIKQQNTCEICAGPCETHKGYEYGGGYVTNVDAADLKLERDGRFEVEAALDAHTLDEYRVEKSYLIWPQDGFEREFALLVAALRESGKSLVGTSILSGSTRTLVLRWSDDLQVPVLHVCIYDEQVAWTDVDLVRSLLDAAPAAGEQEQQLAQLLVDSLPGSYAWGDVVDEYEVALTEAIAAAAEGKPLAVKPKTEAPAPTVDLMAALKASVAAQSKPKPAAKKPAAKKTTRKVAA